MKERKPSAKIKGNLTSLRKIITRTQVALIVSVTIFLSSGGLIINIKSNNKAFNQNLQNTTALVSRIYGFTKNLSQPKLSVNILTELPLIFLK